MTFILFPVLSTMVTCKEQEKCFATFFISAQASAILSDFFSSEKKSFKMLMIFSLFFQDAVSRGVNRGKSDSLKAAILAHVLGARCHDAPINLLASGLRSKGFVPLNRLLLGRTIMNSAGASEIRPKIWGLGIHRRDWSIFPRIYTSWVHFAATNSTWTTFLPVAFSWIFWMKNRIDSTHTEPCAIAHCLWNLFAVGKVPGELNLFFFFLFEEKQRN